MNSTMLRSTARKWAAVVALVFCAIALCISDFSGIVPKNAQTLSFAQNSTQTDIPQSANVDSWSGVAQNITQDLNEATEKLSAGDMTTAASAFQRAYNVDFVASNFASVAQTYADAQNQQNQQTLASELLAFTTDVYSADKRAALPQRIQSAQNLAATVASQLDSRTDLKNPRDYATELAQKTQEERKKLDAAKTRKNTGKGSRTWSDVASEMTTILDNAQKAATTGGNDRRGSDLVNHAYYQYYEKLGFEKTVMSAISGDRVSQVENQFKETRKSMVGGKSDSVVTKNVKDLKAMLVADAKVLDNGAAARVNPFVTFVTSSFGQAFVILLREGLEAILVVAAIVSYLIKAGERKKLKYIYFGVLAGLVASGIMAALLMFVYSSAQGSGQELFEGITALFAMVMLMYTSNWMLGKSGNRAWAHFIDDKTKASLSSGSIFSLALLAFLAVFREGAETVIFYQALAAMISDDDFSPLWWGAGVAVVALIVIFVLFRVLSLRIPYKAFFSVMSAIIAVMVVIFAGSGLHELIEADVVNGTYMSSWPTNDFLGIYPYVQTVVFQIIITLIVIALLTVTFVRGRRVARLSAQNAQHREDGGIPVNAADASAETSTTMNTDLPEHK